MNREKLEVDQVRASEAQHILNHHLVKDAFEYLESTYTQAWRNCRDDAKRLQAGKMLDALFDFRSHFQTVLTTGRLADNEIATLVRIEKARRRYE